MSADAINVGHLRALVERIERVEADIKALNADKSEIYKEARGYGYDVKALRSVVAKRKLDMAEREERDAIFSLYWDALHSAPSRVHVHEADDFDPTTGEVHDTQEHPSAGEPLDAGCTVPSESTADEISDPAQPSSRGPRTAGEGTPPPVSSPATLSDADVPAFLKQDKPGCLKLRDGHCKIGFATEALCAECADKRARAMA